LLRVALGIALFGTVFILATTVAVVLAAGLLGVVGLPVDARLGVAVLIAFGVLLVVRGSRSVRRVAEPIGDLVEAAGRIEAGDLSARVEERGPREVRWLIGAFNDMSARLAADELSRRTLLADITHELRTPLTVIQGNLEGLLDGVYPADEAHLSLILEESRTLGRLIDDLRTLALADRGALDLRPEDVDLLTLANETVAGLRAAADAAGVTVTVPVEQWSDTDFPTVSADPTRIREVLGNLLSNALQHSPRGSAILVEVGTSADARAVTVAVSDRGRGIPADVLPRAFDRFVKSPDSRGSGLGLAIARDLIQAHGGSIEASSPPGGGTTIRFSLPVAVPQA
jgi:signal transduction histidine kinase